MDLKHEIRTILAEISALPQDFDAAADLYADLGLPSMGAMELLARLEEHFQIPISDDDFIESRSLDSLATLVEKGVAQKL